MKRIITTLCIVAIAATTSIAQHITYEEYMQQVFNNNTALVAQSMDIEIARAEVKSSKTYNDPTFSVEYGNKEDWDKKLGYSIGVQLSRKFTFGVRKAGIRLAEEELQATTAVFNDYLNNLHADATIAYLAHLRAKSLLDTAKKREEYMQQLANGDSLRFVGGEISKSTWIETRIAAGLARNSRLTAEAEYENSIVTLAYYMGNTNLSNELTAAGSLEESIMPLENLDYYIEQAMENRATITAAISRVDIAEAQKRLNSARRRIDLQLSIGAEYNKGAHRNEPEEPSFTNFKVSAAIPLKFSNLNGGARAMERASVEQAQQELTDTRLKIQSEVMQAYNNCRIAAIQTKTFTQGMLEETAEMLAGKRKAYQAGEISFIEFIETERSDNMVQEEYINAIFNNAISHVELLRSIGTKSDRK